MQILKDYIQEWQSPDFHSISVQPFIWLLLLSFAAVGISQKRIALTDCLLFSIFTYMGLLAGRNIALFALAAPLVLTRHAAPLLDTLGRRWGINIRIDAVPRAGRAALNWFLLALLALAALIKTATVFPRQVNEEAFAKSVPVEAVAFIQSKKLPGRLFNSYNWGGYLIWALPGYPVFIDGRTDLYDDETIAEWLKVMRAQEGWQETLDRYQVNTILVESNVPLAHRLLVDQGWARLYSDDLAVVFVRASP